MKRLSLFSTLNSVIIHPNQPKNAVSSIQKAFSLSFSSHTAATTTATSTASPPPSTAVTKKWTSWKDRALFVLAGFILGRELSQFQDDNTLRSHHHPFAAAHALSSPTPSPIATMHSHSTITTAATTTSPLAGCLSPYFIADAAAKAAPAVVNILVQQQNGGGLSSTAGSSGSGFIINKDGTVLTNAHVVADAFPSHRPALPSLNTLNTPPNKIRHATKHAHKSPNATLQVTLQDGRIYEADLVNYDLISDVAVLRVKADSPLPVARIGSSGAAGLRVGEWVLALGSPLHLQNSVSAGIVSCVDRKAVELGLTGGSRTEYIQTDASINRGSSGGPLVNLSGEVVGVSCMKALAADGVSFAIPIDSVLEVVRQLNTHGRVIRPYAGIKLLQLTRNTIDQMRKKDPLALPRISGGVLVPQVAPHSPASKAGLRPGDVIVAYFPGEGQKREGTVTIPGLIKALEEHIGRELRLEVLRSDGRGGGETVTISVLAEEYSDKSGM